MKASLFGLGVLAGLASANINFVWVNPTCDHLDPTSLCLTGQHCSETDCCVPDLKSEYSKLVSRSSLRVVPAKRQTAKYSQDGKCGPANGNLLCDPNSTVYKGTCCSQYGWCGSTAAHCTQGCLSGCDNGASKPAPQPSKAATAGAAKPRTDGRCGKDFGGATCDANGAYGGCCSSYGYCGSTDGHCLAANGCQNGCKGATATQPAKGNPAPVSSRPPSTTTSGEPVLGKPSTAPASKPTGVATTDGSCGAKFGNTVCGNWAQGSCCSMYGYCGNTTSHCGEGCQNGPCLRAPSVPAPAASPAPRAAKPGSIQLKGRSGVPAMHAGLMPNGKVVFLDKVENYTELKLANGQYAYSSEWDPVTDKLTPLAYKTNAFCSGGIFLADGRFASLGGNAPLDFIDPTVGDGFRGIRLLKRSSSDASLDGQAWNEPGPQLDTPRWYASVQIMPDDSIFVASGSKNGLDPSKPENNNPTYEMLNADGSPRGVSKNMEILSKNQPYYMYPFMHLMKDGNLFVQVSKSAEIFKVETGSVVRMLPDLPGSYRTYPNTGGSVMLPLSSANDYNPDIVICGGGPYQDITAPADPSCGRIRPLDADPEWEMDSMPEGRGMVEGTLLPDGTVVWVNGAQEGAQGFGVAQDPALEVLLYDPNQPKGKRFTTGPASTIARLYHSVALLLLDGTLLISGSNPVEQPILKPDAKNPYVTEFRNEIYTPPYLQGNPTRPSAVQISQKELKVQQQFNIKFNAPANAQNVKISLYYGGFVTHSVHMGHRMIFLDNTGFKAGATAQSLTVTMPPNKAVAPAGPYVIYVVVDGVPAMGQFVHVS
ncbi:hypothetical protein J4E93_001455 [Alternaria ventricosa]|uniref:uncharacterized protein n=1 Tax=Alternaria ventricosa TaxID=1187951 RepID=UPI0020C4D390|nr:uncharacterized protein J4E93_001455 [Alternaria ventricosa]KAI4653688.1 hypothetical protein J4E93_001455 [Alternaria ventricosa]